RGIAPNAARAMSRRVDRGGQTEGASSGDRAGRVAVVAPGSQGRGPCGLPARRAERPAERVRGALPSSLASLPTYVQRADRVLANDRRPRGPRRGILRNHRSQSPGRKWSRLRYCPARVAQAGPQGPKLSEAARAATGAEKRPTAAALKVDAV